jgi:hypothetical protein
MPKFNRQNKKKIDPRYFLNETIDPDTNADDSLELIDMLIDQIRDYSKELTGFRDHFGDMDELLQMSIQDLKNKLVMMANSPQASSLEIELDDEERAADPDEKYAQYAQPKGMGMGRAAGLREAELKWEKFVKESK